LGISRFRKRITMNTNINSRNFITSVLLAVLSLVVTACAPSATPVPTQDVGLIQTQAAKTVVAEFTLNAPPPSTATPPPTVPPTAPPPTATPQANFPNIPVAVVPTAAPGSPSAVAQSHTTIYSGPGTNYVVYSAFLNGQNASITGRSEDSQWWAISLPVAPEGIGWLSARSVTAFNAGNVPVLPTPPVPPTTNMVPPDPNDPQAMALANTFVRSGPAVNFPAYGIAQAGASGRVIGVSEDRQWWVVRLNPTNVGVGFGWVSGQFVQAINTNNIQVIQNPATPVVVVPPAPPSGAAIATATDFINVRAGPGTNFSVLVVAPPGSTAEVTGRSADSGWWQVRVPTRFSPNGLGWVSAQFVVTQNTGSVPVVGAPPPSPTIAAVPPIAIEGCAIVSQNPANSSRFSADTSFTTTWGLRNTSSQAWDRNGVDLRFVGAENNVQMHTGPSVFDMSTDVNPGSMYNFSVSMIAPSNTGNYGEVWEVVRGTSRICQFSVFITVP
jgi:uncharacterized protein YraI